MKALRLPVSKNKNFEVDLLCSYVLSCDIWGETFLTPGALYKKKKKKNNRDKGPLLDATCQISKL